MSWCDYDCHSLLARRFFSPFLIWHFQEWKMGRTLETECERRVKVCCCCHTGWLEWGICRALDDSQTCVLLFDVFYVRVSLSLSFFLSFSFLIWRSERQGEKKEDRNICIASTPSVLHSTPSCAVCVRLICPAAFTQFLTYSGPVSFSPPSVEGRVKRHREDEEKVSLRYSCWDDDLVLLPGSYPLPFFLLKERKLIICGLIDGLLVG